MRRARGGVHRSRRGRRFPVLRQRLSYLSHVGKEGVERPDYGAIPRVLERRQRIHVLIDDDRFAAFRQRLKKLGQCRPVTIKFYDEGPAADVAGLDCCPVMLVVLLGSPVPM